MAVAGKNPDDITSLLAQWDSGNRGALDALMPLIYEELRRRARSYLRSENPGHTLQTTALVHETYLRLTDQDQVQLKDRAHFFAVASHIMRHILVDHARSRHRLKRGGPALKVELAEDMVVSQPNGIDLLDLDDALTRLAALDPQQARLVELRFYGGLSIDETAEAMDISPATVKREWSMARAWLFRELDRQ